VIDCLLGSTEDRRHHGEITALVIVALLCFLVSRVVQYTVFIAYGVQVEMISC